jgi:hypothetical protein
MQFRSNVPLNRDGLLSQVIELIFQDLTPAPLPRKLVGREKEKGIHKKRIVKLSAKMLMIAWSLMKKKESFDPAYLNAE